MANQIPKEIVEKVRKANDIVDIIGEYVQLKKKGKSFFGLCPFHGEKTPSFSVTQEKQIFYCFGCGKGGTAVNFLMEMENYSFREAIKFLADKSGISLPDTGSAIDSALPKEAQNTLSAYEWLTKLYHHLLRYTKEGKDGYQYFKERGINEDTIDNFQLGFAPNAKAFTAEFLEKKGFNLQILAKSGILSLKENNQAIDRFGGRVIFPIRNHLGKTVAFGGRTITGQEPKYLNSPESALFQKGRLLYNFDMAKKHIRKKSEAILFEGYMDVISAYQAGVENAIATLGTSLTESQAKLLRRYVDTVILCYDADHAGIEATYRASGLLQAAGCHVKVARLKEEMDPDSFLQTYGADAFKNEVIGNAESFMGFYMRYAKKDYNMSLENDRIQYMEQVIGQLALVESPIEQEYHLKTLSEEYNISLDALKQELQQERQRKGVYEDKRKKKRYTNSVTYAYQAKKMLPAFHNAERQLITHMLRDLSIAEKVWEDIGASFNIDEHKIIATHLYAFYEEGNEADVSMFIERLQDQEIRQLVAEIALNPVHEDISNKEIDDYVRTIRDEINNHAYIKKLKEEQRNAELQKNPIEAAKIAMQIIELHKNFKKTN